MVEGEHCVVWFEPDSHNGGGNNVRFGDSFTEDQFQSESFDYFLSNPPFGVDWKKQQKEIQAEHDKRGLDGRFGAGLPRVNDGAFLFLQHMWSKREDVKPAEHKQGSRLAIVFSGSPMFTGGAGSGESDIRKWLIENDWLEAIIALPESMFYNTGIGTYVWIVTNRKEKQRKGKMLLLELVEGHAEKPGTLRWYEAQLKYVREVLPQEVAAVEEQRRSSARKVHASIAAIKDVYRELFASVQELIEGSVIIKEGFKLTFDSSILERTLQQDLFEKYINQGVAGSFCGKEKGVTMLEELRVEYDFNKADDAIAFAEKITSHLRRDMRGGHQGNMNLTSQLRKHVEPKQFYDYLWAFPYLAPEYSLKLHGKDLSHLSPGERGTLLLVFYLLVDKSNNPIIVDQPEENLDSQTVYRLLIPVIKEVKKRRQIIMVTHSPNIAVVCDAEQIIHAFIDRADGNRVVYTMGAIESPQINKYLVDVLEGTRPAFDNRESKYYAG